MENLTLYLKMSWYRMWGRLIYMHKVRVGAYIIVEQVEEKATVDDEWVMWVKYRSLKTGALYRCQLTRWRARFSVRSW